ncbi:MAG TPA: tRNA (N(6)-L-threonylcarbamoyladenosine(37)-C(2))-methylthiotransferase MtaB [Candidatus Limnocylindrales bacterium]|nr:tRNA (N(6)-L-threonylcarbamoyladenosine(37)-C(2))-methylthiotransferase MtaB [Candidatus Limnocylindrales bacterium]
MKVHVRTLGCRLNQAEMEALGRALTAGGQTLMDDPAEADQIVVNTCAVTQDAVHTSRKLARQLNRAAPQAAITLTGCYAQLAPVEAAALPGVASVVGNADKDHLASGLGRVDAYDLELLQRDAQARMGRTRAFVKVQDGCDNACTFCVTTVARGAGRSRPTDEIVREIALLTALGYLEIVLTGVHLGSYGHDAGNREGLAELTHRILVETNAPRLRLSSLEPWDLSPAFFDLWRDDRLCPHLHLPLQSGCDATLRRMGRRTTQASFRRLIEAARERISDPAITTDVIAGFPGETDDEFEQSAAFIAAQGFAGMHIFRYSRRPGTAADRMRGHVDETVKKARSETLHALAAEAQAAYAPRWLGRALPVVWEQVAGAREDGFLNVGYTPNYLRAACVHPRALTHTVTLAHLDRYDRHTGQVQVTPQLVEERIPEVDYE